MGASVASGGSHAVDNICVQFVLPFFAFEIQSWSGCRLLTLLVVLVARELLGNMAWTWGNDNGRHNASHSSSIYAGENWRPVLFGTCSQFSISWHSDCIAGIYLSGSDTRTIAVYVFVFLTVCDFYMLDDQSSYTQGVYAQACWQSSL